MTSKNGQIECDPGTGEGSLGASFHHVYTVCDGGRALRSRKKEPTRYEAPLFEGVQA